MDDDKPVLVTADDYEEEFDTLYWELDRAAMCGDGKEERDLQQRFNLLRVEFVKKFPNHSSTDAILADLRILRIDPNNYPRVAQPFTNREERKALRRAEMGRKKGECIIIRKIDLS